MGPEQEIYIVDSAWDEKQYGLTKHSGVLVGYPALSTGKAYFGECGKLLGINYSSGYYCPNISAASIVYQWMNNQGFNLTALQWIGRN